MTDLSDPYGNRITRPKGISIELEDAPRLKDHLPFMPVEQLKALILKNKTHFSPELSAELNHGINIDFLDTGKAMTIGLSNGAPNNKVYVGLCGMNKPGVEDCLINSFRLVQLDSRGVGGTSIEHALTEPCKDRCAIVVASRTERYAELPLSR